MIFKIRKNNGQCSYEEWNNEMAIMGTCGKSAKVTAGGRYVCNKHLPHALAADKAPNLIDSENNTIPTKIAFKRIIERL